MTLLPAARPINRRQWSALGLALALGGLLLAALFAGLRPGLASAAEAAVYPCSQAGLNSALAAGGSATFSCAVPTTVTVSGRKLVNKNVSLDGGQKLILSGGSVTGVFTVAAGVHLSLLNLTMRDAKVNDYGGDIVNHGVLNIVSSSFISNSALGGGAIWNASGASAVISNSEFELNSQEGGAILNGDIGPGGAATLTVLASFFDFNSAESGAAVYNIAGTVTLNDTEFFRNLAVRGGAVYNAAHLNVNNSSFVLNGIPGFPLALPSQAPPSLPAGSGPMGGGAIYLAPGGDALVAGSFFTNNVANTLGGAIFYGSLPAGLESSLPAVAGSLTILNSQFDSNCANGAGGALSTNLTTTVSGSSFNNNLASIDVCATLAQQAGPTGWPALGGPAPRQPAGSVPQGLFGSGGAIFNNGALTIAGSSFFSNSATLTTTGGGGAIATWSNGLLQVSGSHFTQNRALQDGGAIFNKVNGFASLASSEFISNTAINEEGGAVANLGVLTSTGNLYQGNQTGPSGGGGAIFSASHPPAVSGPEFPNGTPAGVQAGAAYWPDLPALVARPIHLTVEHDTYVSNVSDYEGGALDAGAANILASTFRGNRALFGGAIDVLSRTMVISASLFDSNGVVALGLSQPFQGGAIDANGFAIQIFNSTFYANFASNTAVGGAIEVQGGAMGITNSTFLSNSVALGGNGGALAANNNMIAHNLLIAHNTGGNCQNSMTLDAHNIDYPGSSCGGAAQHANPKAQAPANNGGPTWTSALLAGSPAINAGDTTGCPAVDQRGAARVGVCDIGAFEFGGLAARLRLPIVSR
jgi:hypothetical protein